MSFKSNMDVLCMLNCQINKLITSNKRDKYSRKDINDTVDQHCIKNPRISFVINSIPIPSTYDTLLPTLTNYIITNVNQNTDESITTCVLSKSNKVYKAKDSYLDRCYYSTLPYDKEYIDILKKSIYETKVNSKYRSPYLNNHIQNKLKLSYVPKNVTTTYFYIEFIEDILVHVNKKINQMINFHNMGSCSTLISFTIDKITNLTTKVLTEIVIHRIYAFTTNLSNQHYSDNLSLKDALSYKLYCCIYPVLYTIMNSIFIKHDNNVIINQCLSAIRKVLKYPIIINIFSNLYVHKPDTNCSSLIIYFVQNELQDNYYNTLSSTLYLFHYTLIRHINLDVNLDNINQLNFNVFLNNDINSATLGIKQLSIQSLIQFALAFTLTLIIWNKRHVCFHSIFKELYLIVHKLIYFKGTSINLNNTYSISNKITNCICNFEIELKSNLFGYIFENINKLIIFNSKNQLKYFIENSVLLKNNSIRYICFQCHNIYEFFSKCELTFSTSPCTYLTVLNINSSNTDANYNLMQVKKLIKRYIKHQNRLQAYIKLKYDSTLILYLNEMEMNQDIVNNLINYDTTYADNSIKEILLENNYLHNNINNSIGTEKAQNALIIKSINSKLHTDDQMDFRSAIKEFINKNYSNSSISLSKKYNLKKITRFEIHVENIQILNTPSNIGQNTYKVELALSALVYKNAYTYIVHNNIHVNIQLNNEGKPVHLESITSKENNCTCARYTQYSHCFHPILLLYKWEECKASLKISI